jgi:hypothetical protein
MDHTKTFALLVMQMREAQVSYFALMGRAKKSKHPDDFTNARKVLETSKDLERKVDIEAQSILNHA